MANINNPSGAIIIGSFASSERKLNQYVIPASDSTPLYVGDFVSTTGISNSDGIPICQKETNGNALRGIVESFVALNTQPEQNRIYRAANEERFVNVCDDAWVYFSIQVNGTLTTSDFGKNANIAVGTPSNITGLSGTMLDLSTLTSSTAQLKLLSLIKDEDNELGLYSRVICMIHDHELQHTSSTIGEDLWDRVGTDLVPNFAGDSINMGTGNLTATNGTFTGKLTVTGLIDPTGLSLDPQASAPSTANGTIYYDSVTNRFLFRQDGLWENNTGVDTFKELTDVTGSYTTGGAIYRTKATLDGLEETTIIVDQPALNEMTFTSGSTRLGMSGDLNVTADSAIDQDVTQAASPTWVRVYTDIYDSKTLPGNTLAVYNSTYSDWSFPSFVSDPLDNGYTGFPLSPAVWPDTPTVIKKPRVVFGNASQSETVAIMPMAGGFGFLEFYNDLPGPSGSAKWAIGKDTDNYFKFKHWNGTSFVDFGEINESGDWTFPQNAGSALSPTLPSHYTRKDYVDSIVQGLHWQEAVLDEVNFVLSEPAAPTTGDRYINTGTGVSSITTQAVIATYIYEWNGTDWTETVVSEGYAVWVEDINILEVFNGSAWVTFGATMPHNSLSGLQGGIATTQYYHLSSAQYTDVAKLATAEWDQLAKINSAVISSTQWLYLGAMNQNVSNVSAVTFSQLDVDNIRLNTNTINSIAGELILSAFVGSDLKLQVSGSTGDVVAYRSYSNVGVEPVLKVQYDTTGTIAIGLGTAIDLQVEFQSGTYKTGARIAAVSTALTSSAEYADLVGYSMQNGVISEAFRYDSINDKFKIIGGDLSVDAKNITTDITTGTKIGTATTQKLAFYNAVPVIQQSSAGETLGFTAGVGTSVNDDSTFTGNVGATAYRISDIVKHLKTIGLIAV